MTSIEGKFPTRPAKRPRPACAGLLGWLLLLVGGVPAAPVRAAPPDGRRTLDAPALCELPRRFRPTAFSLAVLPGSPALSRQRVDCLRRFYDSAMANPGGRGRTPWLAGDCRP